MVRLLVGFKPPKLFRDAPHHLALESDSESSAAERQHLLELCKEIASFLSDYDVLDPTFLPFLAETRVQRLSLKLGAMFGPESVNLGHPLFTNVTHLKIFDTGIAEKVLADIPLLPALTHLCLDNSISWDIPIHPLISRETDHG
jgi:hypothetical protein